MLKNEGKTTHIMVDIETLGRRNDAAIREVGLVAFLESGEIIGTLQISVFPEAWNCNNRTFSGETIQWIVSTGAIDPEPNCHSYEMLIEEMDRFFKDYNGANTRVWAKGNMDFEVLKDLYETLCKPLPWKFWQPRDLRTINDIFTSRSFKQSQMPHRAVDDAVIQVKELIYTLRQITQNLHIR